MEPVLWLVSPGTSVRAGPGLPVGQNMDRRCPKGWGAEVEWKASGDAAD